MFVSHFYSSLHLIHIGVRGIIILLRHIILIKVHTGSPHNKYYSQCPSVFHYYAASDKVVRIASRFARARKLNTDSSHLCTTPYIIIISLSGEVVSLAKPIYP